MSFLDLLGQAFSDFTIIVVEKTPNYLAAIVVFGLFWLIGIIIGHILQGPKEHRSRRRQLYARLAQTTFLLIGIFIAFGILGANLAGLITGLGLVTVGLSFSLQDVIVNFIAGLELLSQAPFEIGDVIDVDDYHGIVKEIGTRTTVLLADDGTRVFIPNRDMLGKPVRAEPMARQEHLHISFELPSTTSVDEFAQNAAQAIDEISGVIKGSSKFAVTRIASKTLTCTIRCLLTKRHPPLAELHSEGLRRVAKLVQLSG